MSKMGQELERKLDENKYELLEVLEELVKQEDWYGEDIPPNSPVGKAYKVIAKIRGDKQCLE